METDEKKLHETMLEMGKLAKSASFSLANALSEEKNKWLNAMADALMQKVDSLCRANELDVAVANAKGTSPAMLDRLTLTPARVQEMADALRHVVSLPDPVGRTLSVCTRPNGLRIEKVSVPIGVIGFIYESRPNVTVDAAGLCLKSGNAVILRGGTEAYTTNVALAKCIIEAGYFAGMPEGAVQLVPFTDHEAVSELVTMDQYVNLIIPRGGERLIRAVVKQATIPVLKHYKGVCHIFVDESEPIETAVKIIENAKCQRPSACNAVETVLVHKNIAKAFLPVLYRKLSGKGVTFLGTEELAPYLQTFTTIPMDDFHAEHLDLRLAVRIVDSVEMAVDHINEFGSGHSESILSQTPDNLNYFLNHVDAAVVYANASTRFTDGGEFGMGAEIGISTDKFHARGPMGLAELNSYKYKVHGQGQVRQ